MCYIRFRSSSAIFTLLYHGPPHVCGHMYAVCAACWERRNARVAGACYASMPIRKFTAVTADSCDDTAPLTFGHGGPGVGIVRAMR